MFLSVFGGFLICFVLNLKTMLLREMGRLKSVCSVQHITNNMSLYITPYLKKCGKITSAQQIVSILFLAKTTVS